MFFWVMTGEKKLDNFNLIYFHVHLEFIFELVGATVILPGMKIRREPKKQHRHVQYKKVVMSGSRKR